MSLTVASRVQYLTGDAEMRGIDHDATCLVKGVKDRSIGNQYVLVDLGRQRVKITDANKGMAADWFAEWAAARIKEKYGDETVVLVPVPSSNTTPASAGDFRTAKMGEKIAKLCNAVCHPHLRFKKEVPSASGEGGTRKPEEIYPDLVLTAPPPAGPVVLVDDILTTGGHLVASAWILEDIARKPDFAICCGRTVHQRLEDPYAVPVETLTTTRPAGIPAAPAAPAS